MKRIKINVPMVFMGCESSYDEADLVMFGAPLTDMQLQAGLKVRRVRGAHRIIRHRDLLPIS